jgi:hypothetical protein
MKRFVLPLVLASVLLALVLGASRAGASEKPTVTLFDCNPGQSTYEAVFVGGWAFHVVGSSTNYVILTQSWTDESGFHSFKTANAVANRQLVTCHYIGPVSGRDYTNVGFFTPVGP